MSSSSSTPLLLVSCLLLVSSIATAFNINKLLERDGEFSEFSQKLTDTGLAAEINKRSTITVLAVGNDGMGGLSDKPREQVKRVLQTHVVLDYYDGPKLKKLKDKADLTNMYQSSGVANGRQGFLKVTNGPDGIVFGSAVRNADQDSKFVKMVASQPFNISIIQISSLINTPGLDGNLAPDMAPAPTPELTPAPAPSPKKSRSKTKKAPAPKKGKGSSSDAEAPSDADAPSEAEAPSPSEDAPTPSPAPAPDSDSESTSPPKPDSGEGSGEAPAPAPSSASRAVLSVGGVMGVVSALLLVAF